MPLRMMLIPAGTFTMGSPKDEPEREDNEGPQHEVTLSQLFYGRYPVTQAQWRAVATLPQVEQELDPDQSGFKGDMRPVERVSWYDAVEFCDVWLSKLTASIAFPPKLNGNMPVEPVQQRPFTSVKPSLRL
jgi:formylglycine-generating enzyme required for sulfatase activity